MKFAVVDAVSTCPGSGICRFEEMVVTSPPANVTFTDAVAWP
jgi:hypothetical protein